VKLASIALTDVRRFVQPTRIDAIGPGLNVLCAPNEHGKSTVFDALQALFFQPHRSKSKEVMSLRPHVGGAPMVTVEVDLPTGRHMLSKRWLTRAQATVHRGGTLIHQADDAEAFIANLVQSPGDGGPAGLLWVRQGLTQLDDDAGSARDRETARTARRSLMTSVTGEVEMLTGGKRMDLALARTREDLARYVTATGKALKGGPLAETESLVASLTTEAARLDTIAAQLDTALERRRHVVKALADLTTPDAANARQSRLDDATRRVDEAKRHAGTLAAAATALRNAELTRTALAERVTALHHAQGLREKIAKDLQRMTRIAQTARQAAAQAEAALAPRSAALVAARAAKTGADARLSEAMRAEATQAAKARRADLTERLARTTQLVQTRARLARTAGTGPTQADLSGLQTLFQSVTLERALRDRSAVQITFHHTGEARVSVDGRDVPDAVLPVLTETRFDMPGLGHFTVKPAPNRDSGALDRAEALLATALLRLDVPNLAAATHAATARAQAAEALRDLDTHLNALAPQGITGLEADLASLPPPSPTPTDLPDVQTAHRSVDDANNTLQAAETEYETLKSDVDRLRTDDVRASVATAGLTDALEQADATLAGYGPDPDAGLAAPLAEAVATLDAARALHARLLTDAPDLATAEAALIRARSVVASAAAEIAQLQTERATLDTLITLRSGEGVQEDLADTRSRLEAARATLDALTFEVSTLRELAQALAEARDAAREQYFEPVLAELRPMLRILWPDAELRFDGESLLPSALIRDGREEPLSVLSGGTQEQVALLVRLAFARLLASRGHHAPILFDDALVYTDDDRIEKLFDMLHAQAQSFGGTASSAGQQIIVLSCRQRAFRDLGGTVLALAS
jgi:DNA repair exonuclease SbcCD ATPase subunit